MKKSEESPVLNTLDSIPDALSGAPHIVGLIKSGAKVTGYKLSNDIALGKSEAVALAKRGGIAGVGIAHRGSSEYLKSIPDGKEGNNLGNLPSYSE